MTSKKRRQAASVPELMKVKVKICGITRLEDALVAVEAGASAVGFVFCEGSPRKLTPAAASAISRRLPPLVSTVGVFMNQEAEFIRRAVEMCGLSAVQLHGEEAPDFCEQFAVPVIKAVRVKGAESLCALRSYMTAAWLLDSYVAGQAGGTGEKFNWDLAVKAKGFGTPIILAGGLRAENVAEAVRQVRPYGVDVSSGVEMRPGVKDREKVRGFVEAALGM